MKKGARFQVDIFAFSDHTTFINFEEEQSF